MSEAKIEGSTVMYVEKSVYDSIKAKHEKVLEMLMIAEQLLKDARIDEKEKIYENHGCPGFSGPMGVETKYDAILKQIEELKK